MFPYHKMIFYSIRYYFRLAVGCSAYGIHFSAKFVNFDIFTVVAIKEAAVFTIILMIIPFFKRVSWQNLNLSFKCKGNNWIFISTYCKSYFNFNLKGKRVPSVLTIYFISGLLALLFFVIPPEQTAAQIMIFVLCQGFMVGVFYMIGTYTQDVFSTDIRGTTFNFLDCVSKVYLYQFKYLRYL